MAKTYSKVPILNKEYAVVICYGDEAAINRITNRLGHQPPTGADWNANRGHCFITPGLHPVIAMPRRPETPAEFATLAHEAVHAVEEIFNYIGQPPSGEIFAHSVGATVRGALEWVSKTKKVRKRKK